MHTRVIILYDTVLTFSREVECIWKRKWSAATALFLLNRYSAVVVCLLNLLDDGAIPIVRPAIDDLSQNTYFCRGRPIFTTFLALIFKTYLTVASHGS